jgi:2-polyprenyl-3-methyl-5-hydroxy-6-metoxy-1,4-benzoquinol methylase
MDPDQSREIYDQWHTKWGPDKDGPDSPWHQMAKRAVDNLDGKSVLEIGCGRGGFSAYLASLGAKLTAADFSCAAVRMAREQLRRFESCELITADVQNVPFPDGSFDVAISLETLEHVPQPDQGLAELVRVTKLDGKLIISTPNYFGLLGIYRAYREATGRRYTEIGQPINQPLKLKERVRKLRELGCRIGVVDGCGHYLYLPRIRPIRMRWLDHPRVLTKWLAAHSLTVATKL